LPIREPQLTTCRASIRIAWPPRGFRSTGRAGAGRPLVALGFVASVNAQTIRASQPDDDVVSVRVRIGDLDLHSEVGAKTALQRIQVAARRICGPAEHPTLAEWAALRACLAATVNNGVESLGDPLVTALNGGSTPTERLASQR